MEGAGEGGCPRPPGDMYVHSDYRMFKHTAMGLYICTYIRTSERTVVPKIRSTDGAGPRLEG